MLIVLEGLDGAGKSTQVRLLKEYLMQVASPMRHIHFPRYDAPVYGPLITRFLKGEFGDINTVHPQLVALLFAEDRHGAAPVIKDALAAGETVLLDRYVYSNLAYQSAKLTDTESADALCKWIIDTEFGTFGEPRPDLNIFLNVPLGFVESNLTSSRSGDDRSYLDGGKDIHESDIAFQARVRDRYLAQAAADPNLKVVDCSAADGSMLPADQIFAKIKVLVDELLA